MKNTNIPVACKFLDTNYSINNHMFISDYSQFLEPQMDLSVFGPMPTLQSNSQSGFLCPPTLTQHHDLVYSEFTEVISKRLISQPYPTTFESHNPLCPICLKTVNSSDLFSTCYLSSDQQYLIHQQCLSKEKGYDMRNVQIRQNFFTFSPSIPKGGVHFEHGFDNRYFYVEIALSHPIGDKALLKLSKKTPLVRDHFILKFNENDMNSFFPNIVALPCTDYVLTVNISEVGKKKNQSKITKYLPFKKIKQQGRSSAKCEEVSLDIEVINDSQQKKQLKDKMNYKYKFPLNLAVSLVKINSIQICLPEDFEESQEEQMMLGSGNIEELLKQSSYSLKTSQPLSVKQLKYSLDSTSSIDQQKINLQKLISTNTLLEFVKNNTQSRLFQHYLSQCSPQDIELVIQHIKPTVVQLITHQYGNYMIQKLFNVCSPLQRLDLLQVIMPEMSTLAKNKQGTHTLQAFISLFTLNQEFVYAVMAVTEEFYNLCRNNNATHFIQKIIKIFPLDYTINFFHFVTENLMAFALDKNAMCVIKHMMRRLRQLEGREEAYDQVIEHIRRQIIINVTFNVDQLIADSFGNYVIQFCYELFDEEKCAGITEGILAKFTTYAIGKFSSNVLLKCISVYWTDRRVYQSLKGLSSNQILDVFRNKDGNKILLEIMQRLQGIEFWDKLYSVLTKVQPTRFYHDRWGVCLGIRSGQVGYRSGKFPQGKRSGYNRRK